MAGLTPRERTWARPPSSTVYHCFLERESRSLCRVWPALWLDCKDTEVLDRNRFVTTPNNQICATCGSRLGEVWRQEQGPTSP